MTALTRWWRFSLVGAIGIAVQLAAVAALSRLLPKHYLIASAIALELTLVHNFAWHVRFTWRDRRDAVWLQRFVRFHLSSGMVSLLGNLGMMWLLVRGAHLPVVASNLIAILCCSVVNFWLADLWAFARGDAEGREIRPGGRAGSVRC